MGTIYKAKTGSWAAEVTIGYYMQNGKMRRKRQRKQGFRTKKEAAAWIAAVQTNGTTKKPRITVSELYEIFSERAATLSSSKQTAYRVAWAKIEEAVGYRYIEDLTVSELQEITDDAGTSYYTKRDIKALLAHCYKIAIQDDYADKNRAQYIRLPPLEHTEREIFTEEEIEKLWNFYHTTGDITACRMLIMLYTGIRPGELTSIRMENVHLDEQWMTGGIKTEKGKRRKIILPDCILPLIEDSIQHSSDGLLAKYSHGALNGAWKVLRSELSLREELTPYSCRHTYVTRLTALKVSPAMLQELAGHKDYDTTLEYTHLSVPERLTEVNRLKHTA